MFNKENLAVVGAISKDHGCYNKKVLFHVGGTVGTDGHIAVSVSSPNADITDAPVIAGEPPAKEFDDFTLEVEDVKTIKKSIPKNGAYPILKNAFVIGKNGDKKLVTTDFKSVVFVSTSGIEGFPMRAKDLSKMAPDKEPVLKITFNADLLSRIVSIFQETQGGQYYKPITLSFWGDKEVARIDAENNETGQKIMGLIMPFQK